MAGSDDTYAAQKAQAIAQIANVSKLLRDAIAAALPVAPEQYLTVSVPGTVIDTRPISEGGTYVWDAQDSAFPPTQVQQAEGALVDNMIPLANVMIGNTGKSVARSYSRALDCLVAKAATISTGSNGDEVRSPGHKAYDDAMNYLTESDPATGLTKVDIYIAKQAAWAREQDIWDKAKIEAKRNAATRYPGDVVKQLQDFNDWSQANYRLFKFAVQGRYMDWMTNGYKYEVEQNFGIVDIDSVMERIEQSKESLRNSTIVDTDGANEINTAQLTPKNWATLCKQKAEGWFARNGEYTLAQLNAEIDRIQRLIISYKAMGTAMGFTIGQDGSVGDFNSANLKYPVDPVGSAPDTSAADTGLTTAFTNMYVDSAKLAAETKRLQGKSLDEMKADAAWSAANTALDATRLKFREATDKQQKAQVDYTKWSMSSMSDTNSQATMKTWLSDTLQKMNTNISRLEELRQAKLQAQPMRPAVIANASAPDPTKPNDKTPTGTEVVADGDENPNPIFGLSTDPNAPATAGTLPQAGAASDPWVTINASFSASDQSSTSTSSSWGMSVGGGAGWGLWSVGGAYSHEQSSSDFASDMSSCDVSVTFSALVVNIRRPWLYGELFADSELDTATDFYLSPGPEQMKKWMAAQSGDNGSFNSGAVTQLAKYGMFPAYPTSFVVATDTTVEFHGDTQHIEKHFSSESNSGSASVGWGPFSVSSSFHQSSSRENFQMQSTATGCRLTFGAPQVIAWVSQILPALPRLDGYDPMVQNGGSWAA